VAIDSSATLERPRSNGFSTRLGPAGHAGSYVLAVVATIALMLTPAAAQRGPDNAASPKPLRVASADPRSKSVPQTGRKADAIRKDLARVKLPRGFKIELYAMVPNARHMAVAPADDMLFVGTRESTVWIVPDPHSGDEDPDEHNMPFEVKAFAPSLDFKGPDGVCFTPDGFLVVVEHNRIRTFSTMEFFDGGPNVTVVDAVPQGELIPAKLASSRHSVRACRVGNDKKLYVALGQPFNVSPREKLDLYNTHGVGGIIRLGPFDGKGREMFTRGVRNSSGIEFNPKDNTLWFIDNRSDGVEENVGSGAINRATAAGQLFGDRAFQDKTRITDNGDDKNATPANVANPQVSTDAHAGFLGLAFYTGAQFPQKYRGGLLTVQHGARGHGTSVASLLIFTSLKADGTADKTEVFAEGWFDNKAHHSRLVDAAQLHDGSLLVSDETAGAIYRIFYAGP